MIIELTTLQYYSVFFIFIWTGFVRTGLGFGGAALSLPVLLFIYDEPLYWLPIIGCHLLFFSAITLRTRLHDVDWPYLKKASVFILPGAMVGVFGLLNLSTYLLNLIIYSVTLFYALMWMLNYGIKANNKWVDRFLLLFGGYVAGISLSGAPLMVAVFMRNIAKHQLRNSMFVLWFVLVSLKLAMLVAVGVDLNVWVALLLLPIAAIGHYVGIRAHEYILHNDQMFKRVVGAGLAVVSVLGLVQLT